MNESSRSRNKNWAMLGVASILLLLFIIFGMWQLSNRVQEISDHVAANHKTDAEKKQPNTAAEARTITSGKEAFSMTIPSGWGPLIKATDSDLFILPGKTQPTMAAGVKADVTESANYGSDAPSLFIALLSDAGMGDTPQGTSTEFTIGKGDDALVGKKYAYIYPKDEEVGIGYTRHQNDREYRYAFTTKSGKKLDVVYNVYGSDPRNLADVVDGIVQSIVVK